jgi:hypothetical protein
VEKDSMHTLLRTVGATVVFGRIHCNPNVVALGDPNEPPSDKTKTTIAALKACHVPIISWDWFVACIHAQKRVEIKSEDRLLRMTHSGGT